MRYGGMQCSAMHLVFAVGTAMMMMMMMTSVGVHATSDAGMDTLPTVVVNTNINSLRALNAHLEAHASSVAPAALRRIGFLSKGNAASVANELHQAAESVIYENASALHDAVRDGDIVAGLVSGTVDESYDVNVFPSEQISVRAMLVRSGNDAVLRLVDASLVRVIESGGVEHAAASNPPYAPLVVHSCMPNASHFEWPSLDELGFDASLSSSGGVDATTTIFVAALGPYDWGLPDGDYTGSPPYIGFWPDYFGLIDAEVRKQYGFGLTRVWFPTSDAVLAALLDGSANTTEPYMTVGAAYEGLSRKTAFATSCLTSAVQDQYFTRRVTGAGATGSTGSNGFRAQQFLPLLPARTNSSSSAWIAGVVVSVALLVLSLSFIAVLFYRERRGEPLFKPLLLDDDSSNISSATKTVRRDGSTVAL